MLYSQYSTRTKLVDEDKLRTHEWLSNASLKAENDIFNCVFNTKDSGSSSTKSQL